MKSESVIAAEAALDAAQLCLADAELAKELHLRIICLLGDFMFHRRNLGWQVEKTAVAMVLAVLNTIDTPAAPTSPTTPQQDTTRDRHTPGAGL